VISLLFLAAVSLQEQSIGIVIDRAISDPGVSYLVLDTRSGQVIAKRWQNAERAIPVGSLVKPFTALAYGEAAQTKVCATFPANLEQAIAHSSNAYFGELARNLDSGAVMAVCHRLGLPLPSGPEGLTGMGKSWQIAPLDLARAFGQLLREPCAGPILLGMRHAAQSGTAKAIGRGALAKTGTAECSHTPREAGDGFAIALFPAESPRYTVLVRKNGTSGANAAVVAGQIWSLVLP
jgi:cell division protein FtsI/penicillin-binding protein 2